jgi:hypothetical protein
MERADEKHDDTDTERSGWLVAMDRADPLGPQLHVIKRPPPQLRQAINNENRTGRALDLRRFTILT